MRRAVGSGKGRETSAMGMIRKEENSKREIRNK